MTQHVMLIMVHVLFRNGYHCAYKFQICNMRSAATYCGDEIPPLVSLSEVKKAERHNENYAPSRQQAKSLA